MVRRSVRAHAQVSACRLGLCLQARPVAVCGAGFSHGRVLPVSDRITVAQPPGDGVCVVSSLGLVQMSSGPGARIQLCWEHAREQNLWDTSRRMLSSRLCQRLCQVACPPAQLRGARGFTPSTALAVAFHCNSALVGVRLSTPLLSVPPSPHRSGGSASLGGQSPAGAWRGGGGPGGCAVGCLLALTFPSSQ